MNDKAFHILNIIVLFLLILFNILVLFAFGIGEDGVNPQDWFAVIGAFIIWGILYKVQFSIFTSVMWKLSWFVIMVVFLSFWETGLGVSISKIIFK
jgi:hypothetical protein